MCCTYRVSTTHRRHHSRSELEGMARRAPKGNSIAALADWALGPGCRRKKLLRHVGEQREGGCDAARQEELCDWCRDREVQVVVL